VNDDHALLTTWASRPLCSKYSVLVLMAQRTTFGNSATPEQSTICWAVGGQCRGQCEVLGYWPRTMSDATSRSAIEADLRSRGVTFTQVALTLDETDTAQSVVDGFTTGSLWGPSPVIVNALGLPAQLQVRVAQVVHAARSLQRALAGAVHRHGPFACSESAEVFVGRKLQRLDRQLWSPVRGRLLKYAKPTGLALAQASAA